MQKQTNTVLTPASFIRSNFIIFLGFLGGQIALMIISVTIVDEAYINYQDTAEIYFYAVPLAAVLCFFGGNFIYRQKLNSNTVSNTLRKKVANFQTAALLRYAFIEASALLGIVMFITTQNLYYLLIAMVMVLYFITLKPTKNLIEKDIHFSLEQRREFQKLNQPIE